MAANSISLDPAAFYCDYNSSFRFSGDGVTIDNYGHAWSKQVAYDLNSTESVKSHIEFRFDSVESEIIIAFSGNRKDWNSGEADALTFTIEGNGLIRVRSAMFKELITNRTVASIGAGRWQSLDLELFKDRFIAKIDGETAVNTKLSGIVFPRAGFLGLIGYRKQVTELKNLNVLAVAPYVPPTDITPPIIMLTSPHVTRGIKVMAREESLTVTGTATDDSGVAKVTVNGQPTALDATGNFSTEILLKIGENRITVAATDIQRNTATETFIIAREAGQPPKPSAIAVLPKYKSTGGIYHAVIIGNNDYRNLDRLKTAVNDAREVEQTLKAYYGFNTKLLLNATRNDILSAFNDLRKQVKEQDNVLIYYAGHGEFDRSADKSFWLPVDAQPDNDTEWIIADNITTSIKRLPSKHVLIVSDSCYSGTLTRSTQTHLNPGERNEFLKKMGERPSRTLMASGGNEPVADSGGSGHSIFADSFLKALKEIDQPVFAADELFHQHVKSRVAGKSDQVPQYNSLRNSGDEGGDFVFVKVAR